MAVTWPVFSVRFGAIADIALVLTYRYRVKIAVVVQSSNH